MYRVLNNEEMNRVAAFPGTDYATTIQVALNAMQNQGYDLVNIIQPADADSEPYFIFKQG